MPEPAALTAAGLALAVGLVLVSRNLGALRITVLLAACWLGFSLLSIHAALFGTGMLGRPIYGNYEMRVDEVLTRQPDGVRAIVSGITPGEKARPVPVRRARLVLKTGPDLAPGDIIRAPIRFYPVPGPVVPNGFDTQFHAFFDGIGAYGSSTGAVVRVQAGEASAPEHAIDGVRRAIAERIDKALAQPAAGIARALITGDQSMVAEAARETMATAGLAHVLSVSGLHLTLVAGLVMGGLRGGLALSGWLHRPALGQAPRRRGRDPRVARLLRDLGRQRRGTPLDHHDRAGARGGDRRAAGAHHAERRDRRDHHHRHRSGERAPAELPAVLRGGGGADRRLGDAAPAEEARSLSWPSRPAYLAGTATTSLVAGFATLLFSVYHFQQTSPLGLLGNLLSLPLVSFVTMPAAVLAALAMPFGLESCPLVAMGWSIDRMLDLAGFVAAWSAGLTWSPLLTPMSLVLGLAALAWFAFFRTWHRYLGPAALVPAVLLLALDQPPDVLIADTTQAVAHARRDRVAAGDGQGQQFRGRGLGRDLWRDDRAGASC